MYPSVLRLIFINGWLVPNVFRDLSLFPSRYAWIRLIYFWLQPIAALAVSEKAKKFLKIYGIYNNTIFQEK